MKKADRVGGKGRGLFVYTRWPTLKVCSVASSLSQRHRSMLSKERIQMAPCGARLLIVYEVLFRNCVNHVYEHLLFSLGD
jgi:hypothetical protein